MEHFSEEQEYNVHEFFKKLLSQRDQRIAKLEQELAQARQHDGIAALETQQKLLQIQKNLEDERAHANAQINAQRAQIQQLTEQIRVTQQGYAQVRQQKGGFGITTIAMAILAGAVFGFGLNKLFFTARDPHAIVFEKFRNSHQFDLEYQISQGKFEVAEQFLQNAQSKKEYQSIQHELEFMRKILGATRRHSTGDATPKNVESADFVVHPTVEHAQIMEKASKTLAITEAEVTIRSEASTSGEKLGKLKKGQTVGIWDRTPSPDKVTTLLDGKRIEAIDYWYKIEAPDGVEGWVFGHFTNRSLNRFSYLDAPTPSASDSLGKPQIIVPADNRN